LTKKLIVQLAGVWNLMDGLPALLAPAWTASHFHGGYGFPDSQSRLYFMGLFFFVCLFGLMFLYIARDLERYTGIIVLSAVGKFGIFGFAVIFMMQDQLTTLSMILTSLNGLGMGVVFLWIAASSASSV